MGHDGAAISCASARSVPSVESHDVIEAMAIASVGAAIADWASPVVQSQGEHGEDGRQPGEPPGRRQLHTRPGHGTGC
ncbi:hypothetical protein [Streptomyces albicerus]|uniref:hypothetical protein n=1 Tax=Streptomyces albicerus TaxID=2569859 RepID=UPI00124B217E|nr:hypothetical protein [Streptomyces albicerus]